MTAPAPRQASPIAVTVNGATMLSCFHDDPDSEFGDLIRFIEPGDQWDDIVAAVHEHQAAHGCGPQPQPAAEQAAADPQAALDRVRELARSWATLETSPGSGAPMTAHAGRKILDVVHGGPDSAGERLRLVASMAEGWRTPGSDLFFPVAGQRVLDAIGGEAQRRRDGTSAYLNVISTLAAALRDIRDANPAAPAGGYARDRAILALGMVMAENWTAGAACHVHQDEQARTPDPAGQVTGEEKADG